MAGANMGDRGGSTRAGVRHRGERRFALARIGPAILAFELVLVLVAGLALVVHEMNRKDKTPQDEPLVAAELPSLVDPGDDEATGTAEPTPTDLPTTASPSMSVTGSPTPAPTGSAYPMLPGTAPAPVVPVPGAPTARPVTHPTTGRPATTPVRTTPHPTTRPTTKPAPPATTAPTVPTALPDAGLASSLVSHLNGRRQGERCPALKLDNRLSRAAQGHASDMVRRHFFKHTNPDNLGPGERAAQQGFSGQVGETIALGYENSARAVDAWWDSSEQHAVLATCRYTMVGVGYDPGRALSTHGAGAWVLLLG